MNRSKRFNDGYEAGRRWAETLINDPEAESANKTEPLERLEFLHHQIGSVDWDRWFDPAGSAYSPDESLVFGIDPEADGDRSSAADFWSDVIGDDHEFLSTRPDYVQGFAEGALDRYTATV